MNKTILSVIALIAIAGCGGEEVASNNPPKVNGIYQCVSGCSGICETSNEITVTQKNDKITAISGPLICPGDINNNGEFTVDCPNNQMCEGSFDVAKLTVDCTIKEVFCQTITYQKIE